MSTGTELQKGAAAALGDYVSLLLSLFIVLINAGEVTIVKQKGGYSCEQKWVIGFKLEECNSSIYQLKPFSEQI